MPELDHNEIVGWQSAGELGPLQRRFPGRRGPPPAGPPADRVDPWPDRGQRCSGTFRIETRGATRTERLLSLVVLGDLVSLYLAVLRDVDPTPIPPIEKLKRALAGAR